MFVGILGLILDIDALFGIYKIAWEYYYADDDKHFRLFLTISFLMNSTFIYASYILLKIQKEMSLTLVHKAKLLFLILLFVIVLTVLDSHLYGIIHIFLLIWLLSELTAVERGFKKRKPLL